MYWSARSSSCAGVALARASGRSSRPCAAAPAGRGRRRRRTARARRWTARGRLAVAASWSRAWRVLRARARAAGASRRRRARPARSRPAPRRSASVESSPSATCARRLREPRQRPVDRLAQRQRDRRARSAPAPRTIAISRRAVVSCGRARSSCLTSVSRRSIVVLQHRQRERIGSNRLLAEHRVDGRRRRAGGRGSRPRSPAARRADPTPATRADHVASAAELPATFVRAQRRQRAGCWSARPT